MCSNQINNLFFPSDDEENEHIRQPKTFRPRINFEITDPFCFKEKFRVSAANIEEILDKISTYITPNSTRNRAITPLQQVLITLHWLGNGCQYHGVADMHGVVKSTVCRSVSAVINAIVDNLFQQVVKWPDDPSSNALEFLRIGGFPYVFACADGTLINIDAPVNNEAHFVDRHGNHSLNCLMVCGPDMKFYCVNPQWPGATHDARVMRNSFIFTEFERGWRPYPDAVVLGDSAYGLSDWMIPPLFNNHNSDEERRFNRHHKSTRRIIECAYGILKERFPCLRHLRLDPIKAAKVVIVCSTLHNIASTEDFQAVDLDNIFEMEEQVEIEYRPNQAARVERILNFFR